MHSMSNCHVVAGRSLIDLAASRLALRAPALRAATALTRPNQSAQWLPCGRHTVPTGKMVGPNNVVANHRVERGDHLAHDGHDHNLHPPWTHKLANSEKEPARQVQSRRAGRTSPPYRDQKNEHSPDLTSIAT